MLDDMNSRTVCGIEYIDFVVNGQTHTTLKSEFELVTLLSELGLSGKDRDKVLSLANKVAADRKMEAEIE